MTIRRKAVEKIIEKGGHVSADLENKKEWTYFSLRIPVQMLKKIDDALEDMVGFSKTAFMLQAIQEKIKRIEKEND